MMDEDGIERLRHDGHVFRWSKRHAAGWPGHTTFVVLRGGEVVVGDRYASEGLERTYACELAALLDGCFQEQVAQQLGPRVLEELLAAVRRELGITTPAAASPRAAGPATKTTKTAQEPAKGPPAAAGALAPVPAPSPPVAVSAPPKPSERPSPPVSEPGRVDVAVVACRVSLPLAVALRGITRASVQELLGRLRSLPCRVAAGVPREQAEGVAARLTELGAEVRLLPADAS